MLADEVAELLESTDDFELLGDPTPNAVVFRYRPCDGMTDERTSRLNARWHHHREPRKGIPSVASARSFTL